MSFQVESQTAVGFCPWSSSDESSFDSSSDDISDLRLVVPWSVGLHHGFAPAPFTLRDAELKFTKNRQFQTVCSKQKCKTNYSTLSTLFRTHFRKFLELWDQSFNFWFRSSFEFLWTKVVFLTESKMTSRCVKNVDETVLSIQDGHQLSKWMTITTP